MVVKSNKSLIRKEKGGKKCQNVADCEYINSKIKITNIYTGTKNDILNFCMTCLGRY